MVTLEMGRQVLGGGVRRVIPGPGCRLTECSHEASLERPLHRPCSNVMIPSLQPILG